MSKTLYRILTWLSPSYPVGAFAYSHGIEWAVETGTIKDEESLVKWIAPIIQFGGGWTDAVLFKLTYEAACDIERVREFNEQALALAPSRERLLETRSQGTAFLKTTLKAWPWSNSQEITSHLGSDVAYPVAVAIAAHGHGIPLAMAMPAYLHGITANLVSAGVRLVPLGQTAGQRTIARFEPIIEKVSECAITSELRHLGGIAIQSDIAAMNHETQYTRLFRS